MSFSFKKGDRVRLVDADPDGEVASLYHFQSQANGNNGTIIKPKIIVVGHITWITVRWDNGYQNNYPSTYLVSLNAPKMTAPEMDLDEIQQAQELYSKLEHR